MRAVKPPLPQPWLAAAPCTAGPLALGEEPTALRRQVPAEPPPLQNQVNPLKGVLHELCNLAQMGGFFPERQGRYYPVPLPWGQEGK